MSLMRRDRDDAHLCASIDEKPVFGDSVINVEELVDAGR